MNIYFTDYFGVDPEALEAYGAFNISLINDLPLFIDPFLLFASKKPTYQQLHEDIIAYLKFLRDQSVAGQISRGLLTAWYQFPEVSQLWLGFSKHGNQGSGLGPDFAKALNASLGAIFSDFGSERITLGTHLEKLCLIAEGVGRDNISDFTANLIKAYLCEYTQKFAKKHVSPELLQEVSVIKAQFDYTLQRWMSGTYTLPCLGSDYVLLTPKDMLTKDENWINRPELLDTLPNIADALPDPVLRAQLDNYINRRLREKMTEKEKRAVYSRAIREFPKVIEHYIRQKEDHEEEARQQSSLKVVESETFYIQQLRKLVEQLACSTGFYGVSGDTYDEARSRVIFLKEEIENNGAYRLFYKDGKAIQSERDLHIVYRLTWRATPSDFNSEVNNGRGPVDFKVSRGSSDKTIVEFKLAKNRKLEQNLQAQVEIYKKANRTDKALKVIFYFSESEHKRVLAILERLRLAHDESVILIDVRKDNKPSASKA